MRVLKIIGTIVAAPFLLIFLYGGAIFRGWRDAGAHIEGQKMESFANEMDAQAMMWERFAAEDPSGPEGRRATMRAQLRRTLSKKLRRFEITPAEARAQLNEQTNPLRPTRT